MQLYVCIKQYFIGYILYTHLYCCWEGLTTTRQIVSFIPRLRRQRSQYKCVKAWNIIHNHVKDQRSIYSFRKNNAKKYYMPKYWWTGC